MNEHERITLWRKDPLRFVLDVFGVEPDDWQVDVLNSFRRNNRICLKAAKGCGKTTLLSWLAWNFLLTRPDAKIAATSITGDNLSDGLWAEMSKWQSRSGLLTNQFIWTKTRIFPKIGSDNWFMSARSWSKTGDPSQQANALAGLHADYIMFILDESGGIPDAVMAAAEAALSTGIESKIIQAGNPTHLDGPLYRACSVERHLWHVVEVTGDPDDPKRAPRISVQWAKEQIEKYGKDNPWVLVNVYGRFPPASINSLLGPDEVIAAMKRNPKETDYQFAQKRLGIDVARFGDDRCHDDQTEILTDEGWKLFENLHGNEKVLSLNGDVSNWEKIDAIHQHAFDGEMNLFESRTANFCVTDNHQMLVRSHDRSAKYKLKRYADLPRFFMVRAWNGWGGISETDIAFTTEKKMPHGGISVHSHRFEAIDWAYFLGWFVSEGNVYTEKRRSGRQRIILTQKPGPNRTTIEKHLTKMGIKWRRCSNGMQLEFSSKAIGEWLIRECGQGAHLKRVPKSIKDGSELIIKSFLNSFCLGDGTQRLDGNGRTYVTSSRQLADDIQEMLAKIGRAGKMAIKNKSGTEFEICGRKSIRNHDTYVIYERSDCGRGKLNRDKFLDKKKVKRVKYTGFVWCVSTKYQTIYVRRKGVPMWSGNSVIFPRQGLISYAPVEMRGARTTDIAARVMQAKSKWGSEVELIDDTGHWGHGVIDNLIAAGFAPIGVQFHGPAIDSRYKNRRAEMWLKMAEWVRQRGALPNIPELVGELSTPTYTFVNGKFQLEDKDQVKQRLGRSPDCFVAGTMVSVPGGRKAIESMREGDVVLTPMGKRTVVKVWETKTDTLTRAKFSNGSELIGKGKHEVFTWDSGWVRLDRLSMVNEIESDCNLRRVLWSILKLLSTEERHLGFKATVSIISQAGSLRRNDFFTGVCGLTTTVKYLKACIFTIRMVIGEITESRILSALLGQIIPVATCLSGCKTQNSENVQSMRYLWLRSKRSSGIRVRREEHGMLTTASKHGLADWQRMSIARCVERHSEVSSQVGQDFVPARALKKTRTLGIRHLLGTVFCAVKHFCLTSIGLNPIVPVSVQTETVKSSVVYNLTLDADNAYYANGILVANCADALALTFSIPEAPNSTGMPSWYQEQRSKALTEFDPFR